MPEIQKLFYQTRRFIQTVHPQRTQPKTKQEVFWVRFGVVGWDLSGFWLGLVWIVVGIWAQEAQRLLLFLWVSLHTPKKCCVMSRKGGRGLG
jgi:hypothetical protein